MTDTVCSPRVRTLFSSRAEARAEMDRLRAVVRRPPNGLRGSAPPVDEMLDLADCYEYVAMTSSAPQYELGEAARLRAEVEAYWARQG